MTARGFTDREQEAVRACKEEIARWRENQNPYTSHLLKTALVKAGLRSIECPIIIGRLKRRHYEEK